MVTYNKELSSIKSHPFYYVVVWLVILISLIQIRDLECKCLSRHRLPVFLNHGFIVESNPSEKAVIVEKELDDTDIDNIQKLEDSPARAFINE